MSISNISTDIAPLLDLIVFVYPSSPKDVIVSHKHKFIARQMFQSKRPVFGHIFSYIFAITLDI